MNKEKVRAILAENIKAFRRRKDWSQADLAEKSGLSVVYLSDIERGNKWPYLDTLVKMAEALEIEVYELLKPKKNNKNETENEKIKRFAKDLTLALDASAAETVKTLKKTITKVCKEYFGG